MPIPTLVGLVRRTAAGVGKGGMRTQRGKVHEAGKGDSPEVCAIDDIATVDLGVEQVLDTRASERGVKQKTNQKTIRQPIVRVEHNVGNKAKNRSVNPGLVIEWPRDETVGDVLAVIDEGSRLNMDVHRGVYGHKQEHGHSVEYKPPPDALLSLTVVEECRHTSEEQQGE